MSRQAGGWLCKIGRPAPPRAGTAAARTPLHSSRCLKSLIRDPCCPNYCSAGCASESFSSSSSCSARSASIASTPRSLRPTARVRRRAVLDRVAECARLLRQALQHVVHLQHLGARGAEQVADLVGLLLQRQRDETEMDRAQQRRKQTTVPSPARGIRGRSRRSARGCVRLRRRAHRSADRAPRTPPSPAD